MDYIIGFLHGYGILSPEEAAYFLKNPNGKFNGKTLLMLSVEFPNLAEKLVSSIMELDNDQNDAIWHAVNKDVLSTVEILLEYKCSLNNKIIQRAIQNKNLYMIRLFLRTNRELTKESLEYAILYRNYFLESYNNEDQRKHVESQFNSELQILNQIIYELQ